MKIEFIKNLNKKLLDFNKIPHQFFHYGIETRQQNSKVEIFFYNNLVGIKKKKTFYF